MSDIVFPFLATPIAIQRRSSTLAVGIVQPCPFLSSRLYQILHRPRPISTPHSHHVILPFPLTLQDEAKLPLLLTAAPTESPPSAEERSEAPANSIPQIMEVLEPIIFPIATLSTPPQRPLKVPSKAPTSSSLPTRANHDAAKPAMKQPTPVVQGAAAVKSVITKTVMSNTMATHTNATATSSKAAVTAPVAAPATTAAPPARKATTAGPLSGSGSPRLQAKMVKLRLNRDTKTKGRADEKKEVDEDEVEAPRPASVKLRRERQAKRAEQIKFWRVREEREARDARLVERRRIVSGRPAAPPLPVPEDSKKVKFNLKRNRVFEISEATT